MLQCLHSLQANKYSLIVVKTQSLLIATKPNHQVFKTATEKLKLEPHGSELGVVTKARYLGLQVDNSLNWKEHIKMISFKVYRVIGFPAYAKQHPLLLL